MAIVLINDRAYKVRQYFSNKEAPEGVNHCGGEPSEGGHGHLADGGDHIEDGHWVVYNKNKIVKVIHADDFRDANFSI